MSLSLLPPLAQNGSFLVGSGEGLCNIFYGTFHGSTASDCVHAVSSLPEGSASIPYEVNQVGESEHSLPLKVQRGECMIQVEVAGPRFPSTMDIVPSDIRKMADRVLLQCLTSLSHYGGFVTTDLQPLRDWVVGPDRSLDNPYPTYTAFLTVTIAKVAPDWLSPGNYDPVIPAILAEAELAAVQRTTSGSALRADLLLRTERFVKQGAKMQPRGQHFAWWENPGNGLDSNGTVPVILPGFEDVSTAPASSMRKRRK